MKVKTDLLSENQEILLKFENKSLILNEQLIETQKQLEA